jgi:hypothetical protein
MYVYRASVLTHAAVTGMHATAGSPRRLRSICYTGPTADALPGGKMFVSACIVYFVFTSHVITEMISRVCLRIFVLRTR